MSLPTIEELMGMEVSETFDNTPVPIGPYNAVITGAEVRKGAKGPYINIETTIHDDDYKGRKVWRNCSFSEKALGMPGGVANLVQSTQPDIPKDTAKAELPAVVAQAIISTPVLIEVEHEQVHRNGQPQTLSDGSPEMRATIRSFGPPDPAFVEAIEKEAAGLDDDLPF